MFKLSTIGLENLLLGKKIEIPCRREIIELALDDAAFVKATDRKLLWALMAVDPSPNNNGHS